ncbi:hypothetical protein PROFUN_09281 [Planoprotostelium fungivorum]|uniref:Uncharacterized protein n=1 Tax=Planoprotostelium fungivorum TaxID=1890364 RepID=A0A2P6NKZ4_9EUKA|nr:hypothetical protein PROFUN_09281 [Planoprotostelium fungivorum]
MDLSSTAKKALIIAVKNRGRDLLDALRQLYVVATSDASPSNVPPEIYDLLWQLLGDTSFSVKGRLLCVSILSILRTKNQRELSSRLPPRSVPDPRSLSLYVHLISRCLDRDLSRDLLSSLLSWYRSRGQDHNDKVLPLLCQTAETHRDVWSEGKVSTLENSLSDVLTGTPVYRRQSSGMQKKTSHDYFTVLSRLEEKGEVTTDEQMSHVMAFSCLQRWIHAIYTAEGPELGLGVGSSDDEGNQGTSRISTRFEESTVDICLRIMEQASLSQQQSSSSFKSITSVTSPEKKKEGRGLAEVCTVEVVRILDHICRENTSVLPRVAPTLKKILARAAKPAGEKPLTVYNAHVMLSVIEFFICHGHVMMHDVGPAMRIFFHEHLPKFLDDPYLAFELLKLYTKNRERILFQSNLFSVHFLPLFKVFAWSPRSSYRDIKYLLPCFLSARSCLEIFHHIIDLPLVAALLERSQNEKEGSADSESAQGSNSSFGNYRELIKRSSSMRDNLVTYRVLYNHFLRNENGVTVNLWDSISSLVDQFVTDVPPSQRVSDVCFLCPSLLDKFFEVMIENTDSREASWQDLWTELLPIMFRRLSQIYPVASYQASIRRVIENKILSLFGTHPIMIPIHRVLIFDAIREATNPETQELVINLIYILGEYTSSDSLNLTVKLMDELHEVLELMVFERLSLIKLGITSVHDELPSEEIVRGTDTSTDTRFLLVLISALTKLASRWQAIASKVMLCLAKVMSREQFLDPAVAQRAGECITLLKDPSVAAAVYDVPHTFGRRKGHTDENSSLPFILRPILPLKESRQLHDFLP